MSGKCRASALMSGIEFLVFSALDDPKAFEEKMNRTRTYTHVLVYLAVEILNFPDDEKSLSYDTPPVTGTCFPHISLNSRSAYAVVQRHIDILKKKGLNLDVCAHMPLHKGI